MRIRHKASARPYLASLAFVKNIFDLPNEVITYLPKEPLILEIGIGKGDFIVSLAARYPELFFIGVEFNETVLALAARKVEASGLKNIMLFSGDVLRLLPLLPANSFKTIFLNHSDPWPKKRHAKKRLTALHFLAYYYDLLVVGGELIFKTDNTDLADYSLETLEASKFSDLRFDEDYAGDEEFDAMTEYERKFRENGVKIKRIKVVKELE